MRILSLLLPFFFLHAGVNVLSNYAGWELAIFITKPLLMTTLATWFYFTTNRLSHSFHSLIFIGLVFSWGGDCFLLFTADQPNFFLFGLGSFLIAHLFYIAAFFKFPGWEKGWIKRKLWPAIPVLIFLAAMISYLWPDLPEAFKIPVTIYACVISGMLLAAMNMKGRIDEKTARLLIFGALLFVLSDSLIAFGKFKSTGISQAIMSVGIMVTYLTGQYLIASQSAKME